jgi:4-amino-4-deoxy-L-arabinose transferase-like glycosyltransferase
MAPTHNFDRDASPAWSSNTLLAGRWLDWLMLALAGLAWAATPILLARGFGFDGGFQQILVALTGLAAGVLLVALATRSSAGQAGLKHLSNWQPPSLPAILVAGLVLRVIWVMVFPATPNSDGASYLGLAERLLAEGRYETAGTRAYWPPGYPFFLSPWLLVFDSKLAVTLSQLALYLAGAFGCYKLAKMLSGEQAGRLAALLFALWPNLIALTGTPEKEALVLAILPWVCVGVIRPQLLSMALAGLALGFAILVQPSLQFLLIAFAVLIPLLHGWRKLHGAILLLVCAAAVIAPWTLRNYQQFGQFVLVSANGGDVLYRANNPLADGGYTPVGEIDFSAYDEVEKDRLSKQRAVEWIKQNPGDFLKLVVEKQIRFMGDDAAGFYNTLKRGDGSDNPNVYLLSKLVANVWWLAAWLLIASLIWSSRRRTAPYRITVWCWLYLFAIHSVFESSGKYHIPMLWVLSVWIACALVSHRPGKTDEHPQPIRMPG